MTVSSIQAARFVIASVSFIAVALIADQALA